MNMALNVALKSRNLINQKVFNCLIQSQRGPKRFWKHTMMEIKKRNKVFMEKNKDKLLELNRRSTFTDWNLNAEIYSFGNRLKENFKIELLFQAFVHKSYVTKMASQQKEVGIESEDALYKDNENLAQIGEKIISDYVYNYLTYFLTRFPLEGIQSIHDYLTSDETLAHISKNLGTEHIILSSNYPVETETYAKTLKAIIGALAESQGEERANLFIRDFIVTMLAGKDVNSFWEIHDPLNVLRGILERDGREAPEPRLISQSAVNTIFANYHVAIYSNKQLLGHSPGETIDIAIEMAARDALKRLFHTTESDYPFRYDIDNVENKRCNISVHEWSLKAVEKNLALVK